MVPIPHRRKIRPSSASASIGRVAAVAVARAMQRGTAMRLLGQDVGKVRLPCHEELSPEDREQLASVVKGWKIG